MLIPESEVKSVHGITDEQRDAIKNFMQGAIYCWIKNRAGEPFAVHNLMGGENALWHGTPLLALYEKHADAGKDDVAANEAAAKDLGWLVKSVLAGDKRSFEVHNNGYVNTYKWVGKEP